MRTPILFVAFASVFASCSSAYKTGQTPDDVYYSPERPQEEYVKVNDDNDDRYYRGDDSYYDDYYLRMKVRNRYRWSSINDWYYYNNPYRYSYSYTHWGNSWNPYFAWNYYRNPYCCCMYGPGTKISTAYNRPRTVNLNVYNSSNPTVRKAVVNSKPNIYNKPVNVFNGNNNNNSNRSNNNNAGNILRDVFTSGSSNKSSSSGSNKNNFSGSSNSSNNSSSNKGSSTAPVRRF
ncbi:MAG: hypothetical protein C4308_07745 [Chitinophagaceae bacterium]